MKKTKHNLSIRSTSARINGSAKTSKRYISLYIIFVFRNVSNSFNRRKKSKCNDIKWIPKNKKYTNSKAFSPFLPGNKTILNEENDDNPETTDTSQSEKDDTSQNSRDDSIVKVKETQKIKDDNKYKEEILKLRDGNECVDNPNTSDTLRD